MKSQIVAGLLTLFAATPCVAGVLTEQTCFIIAKTPDGKFQNFFLGPGQGVLAQERAGGTISLSVPAGLTADSVWCLRSDIVPAQEDYEVLKTGLPLTIFTLDKNQNQTLDTLSIKEGGVVQFETKGEISPEALSRIQARADEFQKALEDAATQH